MSAAAHLQPLEPPLTPEDVVSLTGLHYQSVLAEIHSGALLAKKVRGRFLITRANYEAWLEPEPPAAAHAARSVPRDTLPRPSAAMVEVGSVAHLRAIARGERP